MKINKKKKKKKIEPADLWTSPSRPTTEKNNKKKRKKRPIFRSCQKTKKNNYGTLGTIPKNLVKGLEELEIGVRAETIQTTALLRSLRMLR